MGLKLASELFVNITDFLNFLINNIYTPKLTFLTSKIFRTKIIFEKYLYA